MHKGIIILSLTLLILVLPAYGKKNKVLKKYVSVKKTDYIVKQKSYNKNSDLYIKAQNDLGSPLYQIYRVVERISRCNKLDEYSWRIMLNNGSQDVNAITTQGNLIIFDNGMVDCFGSDVSALAFVISHEMAHQINYHLTKDFEQKQALENRIEQLKQKVLSAHNNYTDRIKELNNTNNSYSQNNYFSRTGLGSIINSVSSSIAKNVAQKKAISAGNDFQNTIYQTQNELKMAEQDYIRFQQNQEYEADLKAIELMTIAGFDPSASLRTFNFFKRLAYTKGDNAHPDINNRIVVLKNKINSISIVQLKNIGDENFNISKPLFYSFDDEKTFLKIDSTYGSYSNSNKPFEDLFGY